MKKTTLITILVIGFTIWTLHVRHSQQQVSAADATTLPFDTLTASPAAVSGTRASGSVSGTTPVVQKPTPTTTSTSSSTSTPTTTPKPTGQYIDGTYSGAVADAYYGNLQVEAVISGGKLTDVQFLQYPSDRSTSRQISGRALPTLRQEAIQSQSANVATVSGATDVSGAFRQSLYTALAQAKR